MLAYQYQAELQGLCMRQSERRQPLPEVLKVPVLEGRLMGTVRPATVAEWGGGQKAAWGVPHRQWARRALLRGLLSRELPSGGQAGRHFLLVAACVRTRLASSKCNSQAAPEATCEDQTQAEMWYSMLERALSQHQPQGPNSVPAGSTINLQRTLYQCQEADHIAPTLDTPDFGSV